MNNRNHKMSDRIFYILLFSGMFITKFATAMVHDITIVKKFLPEAEMTRRIIIQGVLLLIWWAIVILYRRKKSLEKHKNK